MRRILCLSPFFLLLLLALFLLPLIGMFVTLLNQDNDKKVMTQEVAPVAVEETIIEDVAPAVVEANDGWLDDNGIKYKQANRFTQCNNIDTILRQGAQENVPQAGRTLTRIEFLEVLLKVHCIDYSNADISAIEFADVGNDDTKTKQIIQKSIEIGIANGYEIEGEKVFRADSEITKIESLAIFRKISGFELKDNQPDTLFTDIDVDWKQGVAHMSEVLGILPADTEGKIFNPDEILTNKTLSTMIYNMLKYYR